MGTQVSIKTVLCTSCHRVLLLRWMFCPNCGQRLDPRVKENKKNRKGWKWCPYCQDNRLTHLHVWDGYENHHVESNFCLNCGTKLEETEATEKCPMCPTCNGPSKKLRMMNVTLTGISSSLMQVYRCTNRKCKMDVPYPEEGVQWRTEFVVKDGKKHLVRPTASEFS